MESNSQKESERLDIENLQEYGDVNEIKQENYGNANECKGELVLVNDKDKPSLIIQNFIKTSQSLLMKEKPGESIVILEDDNFQLVDKTEKDNLIINNEQESFESEFDMKNADWKASSEFQEKQFDDDQTFGESHAKLTTENSSETAGFVPSGKIDQMRQEHNPKEKALRYLEENGVLRLFQNLAAGIVHDRPEKPLVYMIKTLEQRKEENCEQS